MKDGDFSLLFPAELQKRVSSWHGELSYDTLGGMNCYQNSVSYLLLITIRECVPAYIVQAA